MADDELAQRLRDYLPTRLDEAMVWLEKMVGINSFTSNAAGVNAVGRLTAECFADLGFEAEAVPSEHADYGCHLFLSRPKPGAPRVVLVTHLDTVFPLEEERLMISAGSPLQTRAAFMVPGQWTSRAARY